LGTEGAIADDRMLSDWGDLVAARGIFLGDSLDRLGADRAPGKWDLRLSMVSISMVIDELGLSL
jgi:asparagine synthase (glutamine-hydrolysing)